MCCGSPLPPPLKRATRDTLDCELIELYGLTEGIITTLAPEDFDAHIESVGKPIPGPAAQARARRRRRGGTRASSARSAGTDAW